MASNTAHLAHLEPWYERWLEPAHHLIFRGEVDNALLAVSTAAAQLAAEEALDPDERQLLRYEVGFTPFNFLSFTYCDERARPAYEEACGVLSEPPVGPLSAPLHSFYRLALTAHGVRLGFAPSDLDEVRILAAEVPPDRVVNAYWMHLATLGFYLRSPELVEEAFGELVGNATGLRDSWVWLRVNLMHQVAQERATAQDFAELLKNLQHGGELRGFIHDFWPHAERLGYASELWPLRRERESELADVLEPPTVEARTRSVLGKHESKY
jgi:hypothetical protein